MAIGYEVHHGIIEIEWQILITGGKLQHINNQVLKSWHTSQSDTVLREDEKAKIQVDRNER